MQKAHIIAYSIFIIGLILKFKHFPKNAIIMMVGITIMLFINIVIALNKKYEIFYTIKGFAVSFWLITILLVLKFWPLIHLFLLIALVLMIVSVYFGYKQNKLKQLKLLFISSVVCLAFYLMPSDIKYRLVSIEWNREIDTDYHSWDKYSWFLYQNGNYEEALDASNRALKILPKTSVVEFEVISNHNKLIKNKRWKRYN